MTPHLISSSIVVWEGMRIKYLHFWLLVGIFLGICINTGKQRDSILKIFNAILTCNSPMISSPDILLAVKMNSTYDYSIQLRGNFLVLTKLSMHVVLLWLRCKNSDQLIQEFRKLLSYVRDKDKPMIFKLSFSISFLGFYRIVCSSIGSEYLVAFTILAYHYKSADEIIYRKHMLKYGRMCTHYEIHFYRMSIKIFFDNLSYAHFARLLHKAKYNPNWIEVTTVQIIRSLGYIIQYSSLETITFSVIFV